MNSIKKFIKDEAGVTAIEYALIAALIAVVIGLAVKTLGISANAKFTAVNTTLNS